MATAGIGCKSKDKPQPEVTKAGADGPTKTEAAQKKRRPVPKAQPRKGYVEMTLDGETKRFEVLPTKKNRLLPAARPPMLMFDAYPEASAKEHLRIHVQDVAFTEVTGRSLVATPMDRQNPRPPVVFISYEDPQGEIYTGAVKPGGTADLVIEKYEAAHDRMSGKFSGTLKSKSGKELKVEGGAFVTERAS